MPSFGSSAAHRAYSLGLDQLGLETVDPPDEAAEQRARVAAEVVVLKRQLVDPLGEHRQAIARRKDLVEQLQRGCRRAAGSSRRTAAGVTTTNSA